MNIEYVLENEICGVDVHPLSVAYYVAFRLRDERKLLHRPLGFDLLTYSYRDVDDDNTRRNGIVPRADGDEKNHENYRNRIAEIEDIFKNYPEIGLAAVVGFFVDKTFLYALTDLRGSQSLLYGGEKPVRVFQLVTVVFFLFARSLESFEVSDLFHIDLIITYACVFAQTIARSILKIT